MICIHGKYWKRIAVAACLAVVSLFGVLPLRASDVPINPSSAVYPVSASLTWGSSGPGTFNNNFFFSPLSPSESVCVYVYNNNPTSAHTFSTSINVSANPNAKSPSDGTWNQAAIWTNMKAPISPGVASNISASVSGAALISVDFSGATTQAGNPDTANVVIIQTTGTCFNGQNTNSAPGVTALSITPIQSYSDTLSSAFAAAMELDSPTGTTAILNVFNNGPKTQYFSRAIVANNTMAAIVVELGSTTGGGTSCTASTSLNLKSGSTVTSTATVNNACSPTLAGGISFAVIPAGSSLTIDLAGYISNTGAGFVIFYNSSSAATGAIYGSALWYEK